MMNQDATTAGYENVNDVFYQGKAIFMGGGLTNQEVLVPQAIKNGRVTVEMDAQQSLYPHAAGEKPCRPARRAVRLRDLREEGPHARGVGRDREVPALHQR